MLFLPSLQFIHSPVGSLQFIHSPVGSLHADYTNRSVNSINIYKRVIRFRIRQTVPNKYREIYYKPVIYITVALE